ncbi:unnamed protein product [Phytophthora fragariaefolia]|uniref:Unnamed protein product n=1 Tax=Phytophthora fragariaefolia TaxID=1490495 RepID=A0A9W6YEZ6_9STRA|nr:unnamed protein product [Phytophthora fragariaefolia]
MNIIISLTILLLYPSSFDQSSLAPDPGGFPPTPPPYQVGAHDWVIDIQILSHSHTFKITRKLRSPMRLKDLAPTNTKRARENAAYSFLKFLEEENVSWNSALRDAVLSTSEELAARAVPPASTGRRQSATKEGPSVGALLYEKGVRGICEQGSSMREEASQENEAYLYSSASSTVDYQDAAPLCLLWFRFGRALDITQLRKANLSICFVDIFFVRFIRVKTSEEQGLSLFPDEDFSTRLRPVGVGGGDDNNGCATSVAEEIAAVESAAACPIRDMISVAYEFVAARSKVIRYLREPSAEAQ